MWFHASSCSPSYYPSSVVLQLALFTSHLGVFLQSIPFWIVCEVVLLQVFNISLSILSMPGDLLFFNFLIAFDISSLVGGPSSISNGFLMGSSTDGVSTRSGRFSTSLKCSAHCFSCSYSMVILAPFLSLIGPLQELSFLLIISWFYKLHSSLLCWLFFLPHFPCNILFCRF